MSSRKLLASILMAFLLVVGIGAATSYLRDPPEATRSADPSLAGLNGETLARLKDYAVSTGSAEQAPAAAAGKLLPDVNTMIEQLAARLETAPEDVKGWRMLGWSYFHTGRYEQAATAYARAVELDPNSAELKLAYKEANAKASATDKSEIATSLQTEAVAKRGDGPGIDKIGKS